MEHENNLYKYGQLQDLNINLHLISKTKCKGNDLLEDNYLTILWKPKIIYSPLDIFVVNIKIVKNSLNIKISLSSVNQMTI